MLSLFESQVYAYKVYTAASRGEQLCIWPLRGRIYATLDLVTKVGIFMLLKHMS